jgi:hypothetical protein
MTGGAFGSMVALFMHLTSAERKTLLVAGAAKLAEHIQNAHLKVCASPVCE